MRLWETAALTLSQREDRGQRRRRRLRGRVCSIIQRIGALNRYYITVVSIPDTLIVIPPTHSLRGETGCTIPGCIPSGAETTLASHSSSGQQRRKPPRSRARSAFIYHRKYASGSWGGN